MEPLLIGFAAVFGAVVGSFLNVVILRLPSEGESIMFPASHCPGCQRPLHWYENIPVFSYLALRGRCRSCQMRISPQYPLVEVAMAALSAALVARLGLSLAAGYYFVFVAALLVIILISIIK